MSTAKATLETQLRALLETPFWLTTLAPNVSYSRLQDDHDGTGNGRLSVTFGADGDAWVEMDGTAGLRFRLPVFGGGASPRTRAALLILAEAIRLDNEAVPQGRDHLGGEPSDEPLDEPLEND